jgi:hypothetical protein
MTKASTPNKLKFSDLTCILLAGKCVSLVDRPYSWMRAHAMFPTSCSGAYTRVASFFAIGPLFPILSVYRCPTRPPADGGIGIVLCPVNCRSRRPVAAVHGNGGGRESEWGRGTSTIDLSLCTTSGGWAVDGFTSL